MAIEVAHFDNLSFVRKQVTIGHTYRAHKTLLVAVREIHGDGAMAVIRLFLGLRADKERCRSHELALIVLPGSPARIRSVPVLANEPFGVRIVHCFHESAL